MSASTSQPYISLNLATFCFDHGGRCHTVPPPPLAPPLPALWSLSGNESISPVSFSNPPLTSPSRVPLTSPSHVPLSRPPLTPGGPDPHRQPVRHPGERERRGAWRERGGDALALLM